MPGVLAATGDRIANIFNIPLRTMNLDGRFGARLLREDRVIRSLVPWFRQLLDFQSEVFQAGSEFSQKLRGEGPLFPKQAEQKMLASDMAMTQAVRFFRGVGQYPLRFIA